MGFFSWNTSDTNRSIANQHSSRKTFTVHMITEDGQVYTENDYEGYGVFGGKDFYTLVAELNGVATGNNDKDRSLGIDICFKDNPSGDFNGMFRYPKLVENLPKQDRTWGDSWNELDYPKSCEYQGYFYENEDEDDAWDDDF